MILNANCNIFPTREEIKDILLLFQIGIEFHMYGVDPYWYQKDLMGSYSISIGPRFDCRRVMGIVWYFRFIVTILGWLDGQSNYLFYTFSQ
jgi:hypothetical protein